MRPVPATQASPALRFQLRPPPPCPARQIATLGRWSPRLHRLATARLPRLPPRRGPATSLFKAYGGSRTRDPIINSDLLYLTELRVGFSTRQGRDGIEPSPVFPPLDLRADGQDLHSPTLLRYLDRSATARPGGRRFRPTRYRCSTRPCWWIYGFIEILNKPIIPGVIIPSRARAFIAERR